VLLALPFLQPQQTKASKLTIIGCCLYLGLLLITAVLSNVRGFFAAPMLSVLLAFVLLGFVGKLRLRPSHATIFVLCIPIGLLFLAQLSDLALAMRAARSNRGTVDAGAIMHDTMTLFADKKYLTSYREELSTGMEYLQYNEFYVSSPFLSRFVITKFIDNTLAYIPKYTPQDVEELAWFTKQRIWASLPSPVINALGIQVSKEFVTSMSTGDYMYYLATGGALGGFKTGSLIGNGVAIMGGGVLVLLFAFAIPMYCFFDSFARVTYVFGPAQTVQPPRGGGGLSNVRAALPVVGVLAVSPVVVIFIYDYFTYWTYEGMSTLIVSIVRGFMQKAFFYYIFYQVGGFFTKGSDSTR
jgi:hypothetical protein